jgi:maltose O-acetyltransferase
MNPRISEKLGQLVRDPGELRSLPWGVFVNTITASHFIPARLRTIMYKLLGFDISLTALVRPGVIFRDNKVHIGSGTTINYKCIFDNRSFVYIGNNVGIGIGVQFLNTDHETCDPQRRAGKSIWAPIRIGNGCYIGSGAVIFPGVTIERGCVIAAGAVVTKDCVSDHVYAGIPARKIKKLNVEQPPILDEN